MPFDAELTDILLRISYKYPSTVGMQGVYLRSISLREVENAPYQSVDQRPG